MLQEGDTLKGIPFVMEECHACRSGVQDAADVSHMGAVGQKVVHHLYSDYYMPCNAMRPPMRYN